jgi:hypothetical protein
VTLALGLAAVFVGSAMALAGYTKRPLGRLLFGYWDAPGSSSSATDLPPAPANAASGGVHAPGQPNPSAGKQPGGRPS